MAKSPIMPIEQGYGQHMDPVVDEPDLQIPMDELDEGLESGESQVVENTDGSALVKLDEEDETVSPEEQAKFLTNLSEKIVPEDELQKLSSRLCQLVEQDRDDRSLRDKQYTEGIKRTGLGKEVPGGAAFEGASRVVHPMLVEGCIDFAARAMKELFPPKGPVRVQIIGEATTAKTEKAERKKRYMNWQLTKQIREYRAELEQTLTQVPLGGSQFLKIRRSDTKKRTVVEFVPIDDVFLPYAASSFDSSERKTHRQFITDFVLEERMTSGLYREVENLSAAGITPDKSDAEIATEKIEGKESGGLNEDGELEIYEIALYLDLTKWDKLADGVAPYLLTVEKNSGKVLALYRNWEPKDELQQELEWIVEFGFVPWRGAYKIGLAHIIGTLSGAATGAVRSLLDSALINNLPGLVKLRGARMAGQDITIDPTRVTEIEGPTQIDDIRKVMMATPYNPPSAVLYQLLEWLTAAGKGVVSTAEEKIADVSSTAPVGTTLAMIEQGSITYTAIHARLHESQARALAIVHRLNAIYLEDEETVEELGELVVGREDFMGPMDVVPVSDPNIFSDTQRYAQNAEAGKLVGMFPQMFKLDRYVERTLQLLNYPEYAEILNVPTEAKELDAISENYQATKQEMLIKAYDGQDHFEHLKVHLMFALSPVMCDNPMMAMPAMPTLMAHIKEHLLMLYVQHARAAAKSAEVLARAAGPGDEPAAVEGAVAAEAHLVSHLAKLMPQLQQLGQEVQKYAPQPPVDPHVQTKQMELAYYAQRDQAENAAKQATTVAEAQAAAAELQQQLIDTQRSRDAENMRHTEEMAASTANADKALQMERDKLRMEAQAEMAQIASTHRLDELQKNFELQLESMRQANAQDLVVLTEMLKQQATSAQEGSASSQTVLQAILQNMQAAEQREHDRQMAFQSNGMKDGGSVKNPRRAKIVRNKNGDMDYIELP